MAKYTIDMLAAEMEATATKLRNASESDKNQILAEMDAIALRSAKLVGVEADKLRSEIEATASALETASADSFAWLGESLQRSVADITADLQELKTGQKALRKNQDSWGNRIVDALKDLGNRIGSYVSTPAIIVEAIIAVIVGIVVGWLVKGGSAKVMEKIYDPESKTAIMAVPQYTNWEQWALAICFGVLAAIVLFGVCYGITKLVVRSKKS
jgi:DNA repair exonuclease SbcCD ATPase subunit